MTEPMTVIDIDEGCTRADYFQTPCEGEVFLRTSASGLTVAPICPKHAGALEDQLRGIGRRYPEVYHVDGCLCGGCTGDPGVY